MNISAWELWLALALLLAGGELLHGALLLLAVGAACVPAALAAFAGGGVTTQIAFFAGSLLAEIPLLARVFAQRKQQRRLLGNAEAIIGRRVTVLQPVTEARDGVVLLTGEHWKARSLAGDLQPGVEAQVVERDGLRLMIVPLERKP